MCSALTSLTCLFPSLLALPFLSSYLDHLYPQDPHLHLVHPSHSPPLFNLNHHSFCQPTPLSFHLANFGCTNGLWELKMSQEWVNLGLMSAVSQSSGCPHPPLSPFLHFRSHFFHFNNSFVSHHDSIAPVHWPRKMLEHLCCCHPIFLSPTINVFENPQRRCSLHSTQ